MLTHYTHKPLAPAQYYDQTLPCTTTTHSNAQCTHGDGCKAVKTFFNRTFFWETQKIQIHEELRFSLSLSLAGQVRWLIVHWHIFIFSLSLALIGVFLMEVRALGRTVGRWRINEQAFTFICNLKRKWYVMCEGKERPACHVECELEEGEKSAAEQAAECNCCCTWPAADRCLSKDLSLLSTALSSPPTFPIIISFPPGFPCIPDQCSAYYEPTSSSMTQLCHIDFMYSSLMAFLNHLYLNTICIPLDRHNPPWQRVGPSVLVWAIEP